MFSTDREINIAELDTVTDFASRNRPVIVINCAGISRKDQAEENPIEAYRVNTLGARNLAIASESVGATIVHLSTDDLFFSGTTNLLTNSMTPILCPFMVNQNWQVKSLSAN